MKKWFKMGMAGLLVCGAGSVVAQDAKPEKAIEYRKAVFEVMAWNFKPLGEMVKGKIPFDKAAFAKHAERVGMLSSMPWEGFVKGSEKGGKTEAKPEIWQKWDDFKAKGETFEKEITKLVEVAKTAEKLEDVKAQFGETAKTCKGCHDEYKEED